jgi:hypothetical protein
VTDDSFGPISAMRWTRGTPRNGPILGSLDTNHPYARIPCLCHAPLGDGSPVGLLAIGPALDDDQAVQAHRDGRAYEAIAVILHQRCITLDLVEHLDRQDDTKTHNATVSVENTRAALAFNGVHADLADTAHHIANHVSIPVEQVVADLSAGLAAIADDLRREHGQEPSR